jgi:signal transduction histidine kinase
MQRGDCEQLIAAIGHDLRNPLGAIDACAALISRTSGLDGATLRRISTIRISVRHALCIVDALRDAAELDSGKMHLELGVHDPLALVEEASQVAEPLALARRVRLSAEPPAVALPRIPCDRGRIAVVLANLLGNALKFTPEGGAISARVAEREGDVVFSVHDTGPGVASELQARIFERGFQAHAGNGLGLGLSIAKGIVEAHGGRIWVESVAGSGATFSFSLSPRSSGCRTGSSP